MHRTQIVISADPGYQGKWSCNVNQGGSFIQGGMNFSEQEQRLFFPTCGYYYFSSQISFLYSSDDSPQNNPKPSVQHGIEVHPNCAPLDTYYRYSHSSLPLNKSIGTSTYIGDVVRVCEGGSVKILLPTSGLCCARGDGSGTYISAFLIQESDCSE